MMLQELRTECYTETPIIKQLILLRAVIVVSALRVKDIIRTITIRTIRSRVENQQGLLHRIMDTIVKGEE